MAISAGSSAANLIKSNYIKDAGVISSIEKDIKTKADFAAHDCINEELSKTGIPVLSEESDHDSFDINKLQWIIDPIDGTLNFFKGFQMAAISIALWEKGAPILGVIHNLFNDEVFYSYKNQGAWLNNTTIKVSKVNNISDAILATGYPTGSNLETSYIKRLVYNIQNYKKIRSYKY